MWFEYASALTKAIQIWLMLELNSTKWHTTMGLLLRRKSYQNGCHLYNLGFIPKKVVVEISRVRPFRFEEIHNINQVFTNQLSIYFCFSETASGNPADKTIAVHCVAGLGRAPVLVAIALIEYAGYDPVEAVSFLRKHRRGAINDKQLQYLEQYKRQTSAGCACIII